MGRLIETAKQLKEIVELREENKILYDEKTFLGVDFDKAKQELNKAKQELNNIKQEYNITNNKCQQYYKLFNKIKEIVNENQNGSVINLQNKIKRLLKEAKI